MTSYVRQDGNIYCNTVEPQFNVLSYTWGNYQDSSQDPILVHGIDWPIPRIQKTHFTAKSFHGAIVAAAAGCKHHCEWVWVDVACIPQRHEEESKSAKLIRGQEIGRQVTIFAQAKDAVVWLSSLQKKNLPVKDDSLVTIVDLIEFMNQAFRGFDDAVLASQFLRDLAEKTLSFMAWTNYILSHRWFLSLWTLQEMVLRPDAFILFDDGFFDPYDTSTSTKDSKTSLPLTIIGLKNDTWELENSIVNYERRSKALLDAEAIARSGPDSPDEQHSGTVTQVMERLSALLSMQVRKGLTALNIEIPNGAYSSALHRRVVEPKDAIYGIQQAYGISCTPEPVGHSEEAKVRALEDEFGSKLVAKSPIVSQLFIHTSKPRRSWLITQGCKADDRFWSPFSWRYNTTALFERFETLRQGSELLLIFKGNAWTLNEFVQRSSPSSAGNNVNIQHNLFGVFTSSARTGLFLDQHVLRDVLSHSKDSFETHESMSDAAKKLEQHYCNPLKAFDPNLTVQIAAFASGAPFHNLPMEYHVAIVLVPFAPFSFGAMSTTQCAQESYADNIRYRRIGLMRWVEHYRDAEPLRHKILPPHHKFECLIE